MIPNHPFRPEMDQGSARPNSSRFNGVVGLHRRNLQGQENYDTFRNVGNPLGRGNDNRRFPADMSLSRNRRSYSSSRAVQPLEEGSSLSHRSYRMASGTQIRGDLTFNRELSRQTSEDLDGDPNRSASMSRTRQQCFKTKMCHFYLQQKCSRGSDCVFAHSCTELRHTPDLSKTKLCVKWKKGLCFADSSQCSYAHGPDDLRHNAEGGMYPQTSEDLAEEAEAPPPPDNNGGFVAELRHSSGSRQTEYAPRDTSNCASNDKPSDARPAWADQHSYGVVFHQDLNSELTTAAMHSQTSGVLSSSPTQNDDSSETRGSRYEPQTPSPPTLTGQECQTSLDASAAPPKTLTAEKPSRFPERLQPMSQPAERKERLRGVPVELCDPSATPPNGSGIRGPSMANVPTIDYSATPKSGQWVMSSGQHFAPTSQPIAVRHPEPAASMYHQGDASVNRYVPMTVSMQQPPMVSYGMIPQLLPETPSNTPQVARQIVHERQTPMARASPTTLPMQGIPPAQQHYIFHNGFLVPVVFAASPQENRSPGTPLYSLMNVS